MKIILSYDPDGEKAEAFFPPEKEDPPQIKISKLGG